MSVLVPSVLMSACHLYLLFDLGYKAPGSADSDQVVLLNHSRLSIAFLKPATVVAPISCASKAFHRFTDLIENTFTFAVLVNREISSLCACPRVRCSLAYEKSDFKAEYFPRHRILKSIIRSIRVRLYSNVNKFNLAHRSS